MLCAINGSRSSIGLMVRPGFYADQLIVYVRQSGNDNGIDLFWHKICCIIVKVRAETLTRIPCISGNSFIVLVKDKELIISKLPSHNLGLNLVRVSEVTALTSARWMGKGDKEAGDKAAVDAMRISFDSTDIKGTVAISESEKDDPPMLYNGEVVCSCMEAEIDVAVGSVECTTLLVF